MPYWLHSNFGPTKFPHFWLPYGPPWPKPRLVGLASISPRLGIDPLSLGQTQPCVGLTCQQVSQTSRPNLSHSHHARSSLRSRSSPTVVFLITTSVQSWADTTWDCSLGTKLFGFKLATSPNTWLCHLPKSWRTIPQAYYNNYYNIQDKGQEQTTTPWQGRHESSMIQTNHYIPYHAEHVSY